MRAPASALAGGLGRTRAPVKSEYSRRRFDSRIRVTRTAREQKEARGMIDRLIAYSERAMRGARCSTFFLTKISRSYL